APPPLATSAANAHAGPHAITISGASSHNYSLSYSDGTLTVNPADLTLVADNQTKIYGDTNPSLTYHDDPSYPFVNGDNGSSLASQPALDTAPSGSPVGAYEITIAGAVDPDYVISYAVGTLTVTPAPLTLVAESKAKIYGAGNPTLTFHAVGLVNGDDKYSALTVAPSLDTADPSSHVGSYPITISGASSHNYSLGYTGATLTVNRADLTLVADNKSKTYGEVNP